MSRIQNLMDSLQAMAARGVDQLPPNVNNWLAEHVFNNTDYPELEPSIRTLLSIRNLRGGKGTAQEHPSISRAKFKREMTKIITRPTKVHAIKNLTLQGAQTPLRARQYIPYPNSTHQSKVLVFFHGGGFVLGDIDTHDEWRVAF